MTDIIIKGAKTHNLKNIDITIPRNQLVVITGLSGSGKSSLAFDTLYAEGQRRYVESLSAYARQFLSLMDKPDVDHIAGLSPAIAIEQKTVSNNPRSTVGTITEIYDYLRLLFARVGTPYCPKHAIALTAQTIPQIVDQMAKLPEGTRVMLLAPVVQDRKGEHLNVMQDLKRQGFLRVVINQTMYALDDTIALDAHTRHNIAVVVDRFKIKKDLGSRVSESLELALSLSQGMVQIGFIDQPSKPYLTFSSKHACTSCGFSVGQLEPRLFSFNSPIGACPACDGLGMKRVFDPEKIIVDPNLPIAQGAIRGWDKKTPFYYQMMVQLADHFQFSLDVPYVSLPLRIQDILMHGSGRERLPMTSRTRRGRTVHRNKAFEGIVNQMARRYQDTESEAVRQQLAQYLTFTVCPECHGSRLGETARHVRIGSHTLPQWVEQPIDQLAETVANLQLTGQSATIAQSIQREIIARLNFLNSVGLNYLTLNRTAETLSGGEGQRIRLASQIGSGLVGVMYVLDEPSIGLHQRDNNRLLKTLTTLRDLGNTVIVVEHDEEAIREADHVIDIGPGAGVHGGEVVAAGCAEDLMRVEASCTGAYLSGRAYIPVPQKRTPYDPKRVLRILGATENNLKNIDAAFPVGLMTCVTGVSGSGKSSLINDTLLPIALTHLNRVRTQRMGAHKEALGLNNLDKVVAIDQSPIGRTPRSNPATYTGLFTPIRELFANTEEARSRGYKPGRFSFNVAGGRCESCQGDGMIRVAMHFLSDVYVKCDACQGTRYQRDTLSITYKGKNIHQVLSMTIDEAAIFFDAIPLLARKLATLQEVGLGYLKLGQSATTLSGGEAQRIKLSRELSKRATGNTLYILDEPTTGLHFHDVKQLLHVCHTLRDQGNTVIMIEHHLDVIKTADWIIDIGPEGGHGGGQILATGTPEDVSKCRKSHTGRFLKPYLKTKKHKSPQT